MSLNSNSMLDGNDVTVHSTGNFSLGYTNALEGGVHHAWGLAANDTDALSTGQVTFRFTAQVQ